MDLAVHQPVGYDQELQLVWEVISDVERYAEYAPNLSKAHAITDGLAPARRCYDTQGRGWNEACVLWEEGRRYAYIIDTTDYPYPFIQMKGTWGLEPQVSGVKVYMRFEYTPKYPWLFGWFTHQAVKRAFMPIVRTLMDNWEAEIQRRVQSAARAHSFQESAEMSVFKA